MKNWPLLVITIIMPVIAQVLIKIGLRKVGGLELSDPTQILRALLSPFVIGGLACYAVGSILLMAVLSRYEMSYANLILSFGYVLLLVASIIVFHEKISLVRAVGAGLIIAGIILVGFS
jgi:undecaprenyl phosphate-alpha-L-ara4N flippase subunit ArnE